MLKKDKQKFCHNINKYKLINNEELILKIKT